MATIKRFEDLKCWQEARELCQSIYKSIIDNDAIKDNSLKNQINSASGSIMDNIAEGFGRDGNKEFRQFLTIAKGSCAETRSQVYRALDRRYINSEKFDKLAKQSDKIEKMISGLIKYINNSGYKGTKFMEDDILYEVQTREL